MKQTHTASSTHNNCVPGSIKPKLQKLEPRGNSRFIPTSYHCGKLGDIRLKCRELSRNKIENVGAQGLKLYVQRRFPLPKVQNLKPGFAPKFVPTCHNYVS